MGEEIRIRAVSLYSIRWASDRVVKWLSHFISDPTILHADDGSPHADWIFERTQLLRQVLRERISDPDASVLLSYGPFRLSIENQLCQQIAKVFPIPAFSIQGSDSEPGVLLAKQRPKVPAALHEPLAKPPLEPDR